MLNKYVCMLALVFSLFVSSSYADLSEADTNAVISFVMRNPNNSMHHGGSGVWISPNHILTCSHLEVQDSERKSNKFSWFAKSPNQGKLGLYIRNQYYPLTELYNDADKDVTIYRSDYYTSKYYLEVSKNPADDVQYTDILAYGNFTNDFMGGRLEITAGKIMNELTIASYEKFGTAKVRSGFSGGPVINRYNNKIVGIVNKRLLYRNSGVIMLSRKEIADIVTRLGIQ